MHKLLVRVWPTKITWLYAGCLIYAAFMIGFLVIGIIALVRNKFLLSLQCP